MSLFRLDASILPATSASRALGDIVEAEWTAAHPDRGVVRRDLATAPIPATAWPAAVTAKFTPEADRSPEQVEAVALATRLADELISAEELVKQGYMTQEDWDFCAAKAHALFEFGQKRSL